MKTRTLWTGLTGLASAFVAALLLIASARAQVAAPAKPSDAPKIYDTTADGNKQIVDALRIAQRDHKRVLLQFGANWCGWCHKLHDVFKTDKNIARTLMYEYEVVLIDVDKVEGKIHNADVNARYGNPIQHGLPVLVVLDETGKQLTTQETGALEEGDHHNPAKVQAFLDQWKAPSVSAEEVLSAAKAKAKAENKKVFVQFSAPWCGWCHKMTAWLEKPEVAQVFQTAFVPVKIDVDRMTGGKEMDKSYRGEREGGIPFFVVIGSDGRVLADSFAAGGNVGFPAQPEEIAHFVEVLKKTSGLSADKIAMLENNLKENAKALLGNRVPAGG